MHKNIQPASGQEQLSFVPWFLVSNALATFFILWTFNGSLFLLFLHELGLPDGQVGVVLSLFPFCGVLALVVAPVVARLGFKRIFLFCYGFRKCVMALLLLLPWVLTTTGHMAGMVFLLVVLIVFALLRTTAETAYNPWLQEFIPNRVRGKITGINMVICTLISVVALWFAGLVLGRGTGLTPFLELLAAGCVLGLLSVALMIKVPGGAPQLEAPVRNHGRNIAQALRDRNFVTFLLGNVCTMVGCTLFTIFLPLYVKERLGVASGVVVMLDSVVMVGGALAGLLLGWLADRVGSRPVLMPSTAVLMLLPLGWLLLPRQIPHVVACCAMLYFLYGVAANGMAIGSGRLLFNGVVPPDRSTAYMSIQYAVGSCFSGVAVLVAGALLSACGGWHTRICAVAVNGNSLLFLLAVLFLAAGCWMYGRVRPDGRHTTRTAMWQLLNWRLGMSLIAPNQNMR